MICMGVSLHTLPPYQKLESKDKAPLAQEKYSNLHRAVKTHAQAKINKLQVEGGKVCLHDRCGELGGRQQGYYDTGIQGDQDTAVPGCQYARIRELDRDIYL
jgi:hypothetical protein